MLKSPFKFDLGYLSGAALFLAFSFWLITPMRHFRQWVGPIGESLYKYHFFFVFVALVVAVMLWGLRSFIALKGTRSNLSPEPMQKKIKLPWVVGVLFILLAFRLWTALSNPFIWDENDGAVIFMSANISDYLTPFSVPREPNPGQFLASVFTILSMRVFGATEFAVCLPSLIFSLVLLGLICTLGRKFFGDVVVVLLLLYIYFNETLLFFMTGSHGYPGLLLCSTLLLFLLIAYTRQKNALSLFQYVGFTLIALGAFLFHTFGAVFFLLLIPAHLLWTLLQKDLSPTQTRNAKRLFALMLSLLPIVGWVLVRHVMLMVQYENLGAPATLSLRNLFLVFGLLHGWEMKVLSALYLGLFLYRVAFVRKPSSLGFVTCFSLCTIFLMTGVLSTLSVNHLAARYFLVFVMPVVLSLLELASSVQTKPLRMVSVGAAGLALLIFPTKNRDTLYYTQASYDYRFTWFIREVQQLVPEAACLRIEGEPQETTWARKFYFRGYRQGYCEADYLVHFSQARYARRKWFMNADPLEDLKLVYADKRGRKLYEISRPMQLADEKPKGKEIFPEFNFTAVDGEESKERVAEVLNQ